MKYEECPNQIRTSSLMSRSDKLVFIEGILSFGETLSFLSMKNSLNTLK